MSRGKARGRLSARGGGGGGGGGHDAGSTFRWLTTYGDLVTNLLGFFVIMFSFSQVDASRFNTFVEGLEQTFDNHTRSAAVMNGGKGIVVDGQSVDGKGPGEGEGDGKGDKDALKVSIAGLRETGAEIEQGLAAAGLGGLINYKIDHRGLVITIGTDAVLFETGSTALSDSGRRLLAQIAPVLAKVPNDIRVEGHTDNVPLNRSGYSNWNLSTDRAVAVLNLLYQVHRVDPKRLVAVGYGEFRPVAGNESPQGRAKNRRVEIIVAVPEKKNGS